eukprot:TRINITY_DN12938_c0_g4_i1.p1 TRINITY_DN12938_c0_g4~~TRINITY_DN12938_c0_g4_i1.p1  ORF type:complete len:883 (-),score=131.57 TRINITY_DN12938_c0_g4_i1:188-2446(-)
MENYKLIIIHFDSFCTQFCDAQYCGSQIRSCEDAEASAKLDPTDDKEAWCQNPCTRVLAHFKQGPARKADSLLPDILEAPIIASLVDDAVEPEPHNQRIILQMQAPESDVQVLYWRVRVSKFKYNDHLEQWLRHESIVESKSNSVNITLTGLTAGETYLFEVAGVNAADAGPYSEIYGSRSGVTVAHPILTIKSKTETISSALSCGLSPFQSATLDTAVYRAPNWKSWDVSMAISTLGPNEDEPSFVTFDDGDQVMHCANLQLDPVDKRNLSCTIPCNAINTTKAYAIKVWNPSQSMLLAESVLHHVAASSQSCHDYEQGSVFCDVAPESPQWGCVPRGSGSDFCSNCFDAVAPQTYYGAQKCSGNRCPEGTKWCNKTNALRDNSGCISDACASESCDLESVEVLTGSGQAALCALPCRFKVSYFVQVLLLGQAVNKLLPNEAANITCAPGYYAVGTTSRFEFHCENSVEETEHDLDDERTFEGKIPQCKMNKCECTSGTGAQGTQCPNNGDAYCTNCDDGYALSNGECIKTCARFDCTQFEGYIKRSTKLQSTDLSKSTCCQQTCAAWPCPTNYLANEAAAESPSVSNENCCLRTCADYGCPEEYLSLDEKKQSTTVTRGNCCRQKTCSDVWPCPTNYLANEAAAESPSVSNENCCLRTCADYGCPEGYLSLNEKKQSTTVTRGNCCRQKTCSEYNGVDTISNPGSRCCPTSCGNLCGAGRCNYGGANGVCCAYGATGRVCGRDNPPCYKP